ATNRGLELVERAAEEAEPLVVAATTHAVAASASIGVTLAENGDGHSDSPHPSAGTSAFADVRIGGPHVGPAQMASALGSDRLLGPRPAGVTFAPCTAAQPSPACYAKVVSISQPSGSADGGGVTDVDDPLSWAAAAICAAAGSVAGPWTTAAAEAPGSRSCCHHPHPGGNSVASLRCRTGETECDPNDIQRCLLAAPSIWGHGSDEMGGRNDGWLRTLLSRSSSSSTTTTDASSVPVPVAFCSCLASSWNGTTGACM
ncbi:hypothetical protein Vretifemale_18377, partial [Volvox reticuliferus]